MNSPGSATNLKASDSTLPSHQAPGHEAGVRDERIVGIYAGEGTIPCLPLDHYKSDPARADKKEPRRLRP